MNRNEMGREKFDEKDWRRGSDKLDEIIKERKNRNRV